MAISKCDEVTTYASAVTKKKCHPPAVAMFALQRFLILTRFAVTSYTPAMPQLPPLRLLVAAGGTGGDLFPSVAVVEQLALLRSVDALFLGNPLRMEATAVPKLGYRFEGLSVRGYKGLKSLQTWTLPVRILHSTLRCLGLMRSHKPDLVLSGGTYLSFPVALAASILRIPLVLIESNAIPGKANRSVARRADLIIAAFEECKKFFATKSAHTIQVIGNPIRGSFEQMPTREDAAREFGLDPSLPTLLVFGGSLGAKSINDAITANLREFERRGIQVLWQCGKNFKERPELPAHVQLREFIDNMPAAYALADLVVCRAGGGTVAELKVVAKPSVLIPYPYAANNEQEYNALSLSSQGAALMIRDSELSSSFASVLDLLGDSSTRQSMTAVLKTLARPQAAHEAAVLILRLLERHVAGD